MIREQTALRISVEHILILGKQLFINFAFVAWTSVDSIPNNHPSAAEGGCLQPASPDLMIISDYLVITWMTLCRDSAWDFGVLL